MTEGKPLILGVLTAVLVAVVFFVVLPAAQNVSLGARQLDEQQAAILLMQKKLRLMELQGVGERQRATELADHVSALTAQRDADRALLADLWQLLLKKTMPGSATGAAVHASVKYDADAIRRLSSSLGGSLEEVLKAVVTEENLQRTMSEHAQDPAYWVAGASLLSDRKSALAQLERAADLYPNSPTVLAALIEARMNDGLFDDATMAYVDRLRQADPNNAWADYYAACVQFRSGRVQEGLRSLQEAGTKKEFSDHATETIMARYDFLLNEGCSDSMALSLSALTLSYPQLVLLKKMAADASLRVQELSDRQQYAEALQIAESLIRAGRSIPSSGRFIIYDRVGTGVFQSGLFAMKEVYEDMGDSARAREIDSQLQGISQRASLIETMVQSFGPALHDMDEAGLVAYIKAAMIDGEFSALQNLPSVARGMEGALPPGR